MLATEQEWLRATNPLEMLCYLHGRAGARKLRLFACACVRQRTFDELPFLADALEEAGCDDETILTHCRRPAEHVRGCWVVDLLLGKD